MNLCFSFLFHIQYCIELVHRAQTVLYVHHIMANPQKRITKNALVKCIKVGVSRKLLVRLERIKAGCADGQAENRFYLFLVPRTIVC